MKDGVKKSFQNRQSKPINILIYITISLLFLFASADCALSLEFYKQIEHGNDDAEINSRNRIVSKSSTLEVGYESGRGNDGIYLRFTGLEIPQNAQINNAYIEFESKEMGTGSSRLIIKIEDADNTIPLSGSTFNRQFLSQTVTWDAGLWGFPDIKYKTSNISTLIQLIINRELWTSGNAISFYITSTNIPLASKRVVKSFNGDPSAAPKLYIEYDVEEPVPEVFSVQTMNDVVVDMSTDSIDLTASVTVDGLPTGDTVSTTWTKLDGPGNVVFADVNSINTTAVFDAPGTYTLQLEATDGTETASDTLTVTFCDQAKLTPSESVGNDYWGTTALAVNGNSAFVGAYKWEYQEETNGSVYIFNS